MKRTLLVLWLIGSGVAQAIPTYQGTISGQITWATNATFYGQPEITVGDLITGDFSYDSWLPNCDYPATLQNLRFTINIGGKLTLYSGQSGWVDFSASSGQPNYLFYVMDDSGGPGPVSATHFSIYYHPYSQNDPVNWLNLVWLMKDGTARQITGDITFARVPDGGRTVLSLLFGLISLWCLGKRCKPGHIAALAEKTYG